MRKPLLLTIKPFIPIQVRAERQELYERLKKAVKQLETILNEPDLSLKLRLRGLAVLSTLVKACDGILKNVQLDEIEAELRELRKIVDEAEAKAEERRKAKA